MILFPFRCKFNVRKIWIDSRGLSWGRGKFLFWYYVNFVHIQKIPLRALHLSSVCYIWIRIFCIWRKYQADISCDLNTIYLPDTKICSRSEWMEKSDKKFYHQINKSWSKKSRSGFWLWIRTWSIREIAYIFQRREADEEPPTILCCSKIEPDEFQVDLCPR